MEISLAQKRLVRKLKADKEVQQEEELKRKEGKGRVVSSYYTAEDLKKLKRVGEAEGIALGGLQHEATMQFLDAYDWSKVQAADEAISSEKLAKVLQIVEKEAGDAPVGYVPPKDVYDEI